MEIYNFDYKIKKHKNLFENNSTLLLGKFDVFHKGHNELLNKAKELSKTNKIGITLFEIKFETSTRKKIISLKNRLNNLAEAGFDFVVIINFDLDIKSMQAKDFIDNIVEKYNVENIVIGKDFRFGLNRMWGSSDLKEYFPKTFICEIKKINSIKISSSAIKEMISTGEIKLINDLLISKYNPDIKYIEGKWMWDDELISPHSGIYFIKVAIDNYWYHGLLHISMLGDNQIFLLNFEGDFIDDSYQIQILQEERIIINSRFDLIKEDDEKKCFEFFYNLQEKNI